MSNEIENKRTIENIKNSKVEFGKKQQYSHQDWSRDKKMREDTNY